MSTSTSSRQSFLSLPPELRLKIYNFITDKVPYDEPLSDYDGLRLSCRLVKSELDYECTKRFSEFVAVASMGNLDPVTIDSLQHLTIRMPCSDWVDLWSEVLSSPLESLDTKWTWFTTLQLRTLNVHIEIENLRLGDALSFWSFWYDYITRGGRGKELAPRVVFDIVYSDKHSDEGWKGYEVLPEQFLCRPYSVDRTLLLESRKTVRIIYKKLKYLG